MRSPHYWRLMPLLRLRKAELQEIADMIPVPYHPDPDRRVSTKSDLVKVIEEARHAAREADFIASCTPTPVRADLCEILAREINAWLRTLPVPEPI